jgi:hypothetical protein
MESVSPVFTEAEIKAEQVVALDQKQYKPIIVARVRGDGGWVASVTRYRFTAKELVAILEGADLLIYQPHLGDIMPLGMALALPGQYPEPEES